MSDSPDSELDSTLFLKVRRERPSQALRERILLQGRAELERALLRGAKQEREARLPASARRVRLRPASFGALIACAAGLAGLVWLCGTPPEHVMITAENTGSRHAAPALPTPESTRASEPNAALPPAPSSQASQNAAVRAPAAAASPRERAPRSAAVRSQRADAGAAPSGAARASASSPLAAELPAEPTTAATPDDSRPAPSLAEQLEQIKRARTALRTADAERALQLLDEYQSGRGGSELAAEARLLRIEALAAAGRKDEAASEARRFAMDYPTSPLIDRARSFTKP